MQKIHSVSSFNIEDCRFRLEETARWRRISRFLVSFRLQKASRSTRIRRCFQTFWRSSTRSCSVSRSESGRRTSGRSRIWMWPCRARSLLTYLVKLALWSHFCTPTRRWICLQTEKNKENRNIVWRLTSAYQRNHVWTIQIVLEKMGCNQTSGTETHGATVFVDTIYILCFRALKRIRTKNRNIYWA